MVARTEKKVVTLGVGVLNWPARERRSDRYGTVGLFEQSGGYDGGEVHENAVKYKPLPKYRNSVFGKHGKLVVKILETRQSGHLGDLFHGVGPKTPKVGEEIVLGTGMLFHAENEGFDGIVGVEPVDGRQTLWLDIKALYRCHDQTVELQFVEE